MHTVFALLCFVVVIHWLIFPYPSRLLHWHCGNLTIAPVPAKQPWWIWINTSCEFITNDCITTTKQSTTKQNRVHISWDIVYVAICRHWATMSWLTAAKVGHGHSVFFLTTLTINFNHKAKLPYNYWLTISVEWLKMPICAHILYYSSDIQQLLKIGHRRCRDLA